MTDDDAKHMIRIAFWWLTRSDRRKRLAMACGGIRDIIHSAIPSIIEAFDNKEIRLTTATINSVRWKLSAECTRKFGTHRRLAKFEDIDLESIEDHRDTTINIGHDDDIRLIQKLCEGLSERTLKIVWMRMHGQTFECIADLFGVTKERIRQIEAKALRQLSSSAEQNKITWEMFSCLE